MENSQTSEGSQEQNSTKEVSLKLLPETNSRVWLPREEDYLVQLIKILQPKKWTHIAKELNKHLYKGRKVKTPKQCRERWHNHLNPELKKGNWTIEEDIYILQAQIEHGNCWSKISKGLTNRNENNVKNRWNSLVKLHRKTTGNQDISVRQILEEKRRTQAAMLPTYGQCDASPVFSPQMENTYYDFKLPQGLMTYSQVSSESLGSTGMPTPASMGSLGALSSSFGSLGELMIDPYSGQPVQTQQGNYPQQMYMPYPNYSMMTPQQGVQGYQEEVKLPNIFDSQPNQAHILIEFDFNQEHIAPTTRDLPRNQVCLKALRLIILYQDYKNF